MKKAIITIGLILCIAASLYVTSKEMLIGFGNIKDTVDYNPESKIPSETINTTVCKYFSLKTFQSRNVVLNTDKDSAKRCKLIINSEGVDA